MKKPKIQLILSAIVIEIAGVIMITNAMPPGASTFGGIIFLAIGLGFIVIAITSKDAS